MNIIFENWRIDLQYEEWLKNRPINESRSDLTRSQAAKILGIAADADIRTAKKAFRKLAMTHHPDKGGSEQKMMSLNAAWAIFNEDDTPKPEAAGATTSGGGKAQGAATPEPSNDKSALYNTIIQAMGKAFAPPQAAVAEGKQTK